MSRIYTLEELQRRSLHELFALQHKICFAHAAAMPGSREARIASRNLQALAVAIRGKLLPPSPAPSP